MYARTGKTFGGLAKAYFVRQFIFGLIFPTCVTWVYMTMPHPIPRDMIAGMALDTLLYPYSRFVYESVVDFIVGDHVFFFDVHELVAFKLMTMTLCWFFAVVIAPIGLAYLYFHHSKSCLARSFSKHDYLPQFRVQKNCGRGMLAIDDGVLALFANETCQVEVCEGDAENGSQSTVSRQRPFGASDRDAAESAPVCRCTSLLFPARSGDPTARNIPLLNGRSTIRKRPHDSAGCRPGHRPERPVESCAGWGRYALVTCHSSENGAERQLSISASAEPPTRSYRSRLLRLNGSQGIADAQAGRLGWPSHPRSAAAYRP